MAGTEVKNLDELNEERKLAMLKAAQIDEVETEKEQEKQLSIAERMMRRAQNKTFNLTFVDITNDDEIQLTFRPLYSGERRDMLLLLNDLQKLQETEEVDIVGINEKIDKLREFVKEATVTEGMGEYYDSKYCQDGDVAEIAKALIKRTVATVEDARSFRQQ